MQRKIHFQWIRFGTEVGQKCDKRVGDAIQTGNGQETHQFWHLTLHLGRGQDSVAATSEFHSLMVMWGT